MYSGSPKHPIHSGATFGMLSGEKPLFKPMLQGGHEALGHVMHKLGLRFDETHGKYKEPERSYIVYNPTVAQMQHLGKLFGQESVVHSENGQHKLVYTNGPNEGKFNPAHAQNPMEHFEQPPEDFYTAIPHNGYARINFDFNQAHDLEPVKPAAALAHLGKSYEPEMAAHLAKSAVAQLLRKQVVHPHPHAYDWHDGHTDYHQEDLGAPKLPGFQKDEPGQPPVPKAPANDQSVGPGAATYHQYALPYGHVNPGTPSNLLHYKYQGKLPEIEKLVGDHGFKSYYAGGKYGKPDLANKNYNTGHLMIYDPTPQSGSDFGHEEYTRGWRQIHELGHALTYPELNKVYGEGRRIGKLGTHRNMNEALRSVHWEWLAAHKQRELSKQVGVHLSDQDFNKELNTVMHDAVHRAVTGKFTEPSGEGYTPHNHRIPLSTALQMVRDAGHTMGLQGLHDTIAKKSESLEKASVEPPAIYTSAEGEAPVPNEKLYTPEEVREILMKSAREKIQIFEREIKGLRERELKKAIIPTHRHDEGTTASAGEEDIPPRAFKKDADMAATAGGDANMAMSELCKACGKKGDLCKCMGKGEALDKHNCTGCSKPIPADELKSRPAKMKCNGCESASTKKTELVDAKGKTKDTGIHPDSVLPEDKKPKEINKPSKKDAGSGGLVLPGKKLNKAYISPVHKYGVTKPVTPPSKPVATTPPATTPAPIAKAATPPTAKPPSGQNMGTSVPTSAPKAPKMAAPAGAKPPAPTMAKGDFGMGDSGKASTTPQASAAPAAAPKPQFTHADLAVAKAKMGVPPGGGVKLPGSHLKSGAGNPQVPGLKAPPAAMKPGPVLNAARPQAKPGIFGKLMGKAESVPEKHKAKIAAQDAKMPKAIKDVMSPPDKSTKTLFEDPMPKVLHPSDKKGKK